MNIILCDRNAGMCEAWRELDTAYQIHQGDLFDLPAEAVVSPANSFGFMDGGVDARIIEYLGQDVQDDVQQSIRSMGELLVGQAIWAPTTHDVCRYVIAAPTMRVPQVILDPHVIFQACSAASCQAHFLGIDSVVFPGMGTGVGKVPYATAAKLMLAGIFHGKKIFDGQIKFPNTVIEAYITHHNYDWERKPETFLN